jgi:hypothetical protein
MICTITQKVEAKDGRRETIWMEAIGEKRKGYLVMVAGGIIMVVRHEP